MSTTTIAERSNLAAPLEDEDIHLVCCDHDIAMCGLHVPDATHPWMLDAEPTCPMCCLVEDEEMPCPVIGCPYGGA